ncbi:hypothetical protein T02_2401 [Trichinella nativa]|uniref:Uncharacterized protein n=1 Tax=Trichinella nativa TaxID=6335 RepID=A0A0V1KLD4_9BILA|nr:hypothetical protein T02_2401 [Trichinella nativa]
MSVQMFSRKVAQVEKGRTFHNATTCHVSQTNECALTDDKAPFMAIVICIAQRWKPVLCIGTSY